MTIPTMGVTWPATTNATPAIITYSFAEDHLENVLGTRYSGYPIFNIPLTTIQAGLFQQAVKTWESVTGVDFVLVGDAASVQLRVGLAAFDGSGGILGATTLWNDATALSCVALAFDSADTLSASYTTAPPPKGTVSFYQLALHELGHVLGLDHTSVADDLMYPYANSTVTLSNDDIATITSLYGPPITVSTPSVDMSSYGSVVQKCYVAYYGRPADPVGLAYWTNQLKNGKGDINTVIDAFANAAESQARYGGMSTKDVVTTLYDQLFSRSPDAEGLQYWINQIDGGIISRQSAMLRIADGAQGQDLAILTNKISAAALFSASNISGYGTEDILDVRTWLSGVTSDPPYEQEVTAAINAMGINLPPSLSNSSTIALSRDWPPLS